MSSTQQQGSGRNVSVREHVQGRRVLGLALSLLLLLVLVAGPVAAAGGSFTVGGGRSYASGRAYVQFGFSAHLAPDGSASGHITLNWPPAEGQDPSDHGQLLADVVCLEVNGKAAVVYGVVTKVVNPDSIPDPDWVLISVSDGPDLFVGAFGYGDPPCGWYGSGYPLYEGNIVVKDR